MQGLTDALKLLFSANELHLDLAVLKSKCKVLIGQLLVASTVLFAL